MSFEFLIEEENKKSNVASREEQNTITVVVLEKKKKSYFTKTCVKCGIFSIFFPRFTTNNCRGEPRAISIKTVNQNIRFPNAFALQTYAKFFSIIYTRKRISRIRTR